MLLETALAEMVKNPDLTAADKLLIQTAWLLGPQSMSDLAALSGLSSNTVSSRVRRLADIGWMKIVPVGKQPGGRKKPVPSVPSDVQKVQVERWKVAYSCAAQKGEFLAKSLMDVLIPVRNFIDNARPDFLINPLSSEPMEYDRYYPDGWAFEFNGPQHYGPTDKFPGQQDYRDTAARDLMKQALSLKHGITLVVLTYKDLSIDGMRKAIPPGIPIRAPEELDTGGPYIRALERTCKDYRAWADRITSSPDRSMNTSDRSTIISDRCMSTSDRG